MSLMLQEFLGRLAMAADWEGASLECSSRCFSSWKGGNCGAIGMRRLRAVKRPIRRSRRAHKRSKGPTDMHRGCAT